MNEDDLLDAATRDSSKHLRLFADTCERTYALARDAAAKQRLYRAVVRKHMADHRGAVPHQANQHLDTARSCQESLLTALGILGTSEVTAALLAARAALVNVQLDLIAERLAVVPLVPMPEEPSDG